MMGANTGDWAFKTVAASGTTPAVNHATCLTDVAACTATTSPLPRPAGGRRLGPGGAGAQLHRYISGDEYNWADLDSAYNWSARIGGVFRMHNLIWGA